MTPQLQQAIRLLQLSTVELCAEVQEALETNPLLELVEPGESETDVGLSAEEAGGAWIGEPCPGRAGAGDRGCGGRSTVERHA